MSTNRHVITQPGAPHVVGIALRTHNGLAFETIPPHWAAFGQTRLAARLFHRLSDEVYAVCTNFENVAIDHSGRCTLVIGNAVPGQWADRPPEVLTPASLRAVFPMEKRSFDLVEAEWQAAWQSSSVTSRAAAWTSTSACCRTTEHHGRPTPMDRPPGATRPGH